ncbi:fungal-specific transcription factor domain-containing protein [Plectosphaerella cucumerina]|uniref:Fungal-specific transcription factor domain-containing protein n=1 Tax=Plectosphaerella cucumerina TaxID=40658 RepID=A0A8K0X9V4_9PEZI|nr:fungal-specific transcription factor domain-containing protein [Plectosphaerella cucumerina]
MDSGRNTAHPGAYDEPAGSGGAYAGYPPGGEHYGPVNPEDASAATSSSVPTTPAAPSSSSARPIRRRMRLITSCLECRRRKLKCDKSQPCTNCVRFGRECLYLGPALDQASQVRLTEMKEKVGSLERQLERDVARSGKAQKTPAARRDGGILADDVEDEFAEERDLEPTELTALDITYEDDADGTDDIIDLGVQVGRMRITDRIGGLTRPRLSEEISTGISGRGGPPPQVPGAAPGAGPPPGASAAGRPPGFAGPPPGMPPGMGPPGMPPGMPPMPTLSPDAPLPDFLRPSSTYLAPSSGLFFGGQGFGNQGLPSLESLLPARQAGDYLLRQYFAAVHPVARVVHRPSFEADYEVFWGEVMENYEPRASTQAIVFAAWFSAAVSLDEAQVQQDFGLTKEALVDRFKVGTETALSKAKFLKTTRVETIQAFVMYMIPLCRAEVSRAHSVLLAAAVRMAECMGLHRDGETYGLNPLDTHVRRLIWHQLCFLDIRTCEAQGPRPVIRREDYDTKLPLNVEDEFISVLGVSPEPSKQWTTILPTLIRFEINEMMRNIWADRRKLESRRINLTDVLIKIETFRRRVLERYEPMMLPGDGQAGCGDEPLKQYTRLVAHLLLYRLHVMVLHPFHANAASPMPHRLNAVLISSGILLIEVAARLETDPELAPWRWYLGAMFQFQVALLLAVEVYFRPQNRESARIWGCLDYAFHLDPNLPPEIKGMQILGEVMGKTAMYQSLRKMRGSIKTSTAEVRRDAVAGAPGPIPYQPPQPAPGPPPMGGASGGFNMGMPPPGPGAGPVPGGGGPPSGSMPMGPPPNAVFVGISDGESLWAIGPPAPGSDSPGGSSTSDHSGSRLPSGSNPIPPPPLGQLDNVDWDIVNGLFQPNPMTGELNISGFDDPSLGMSWGLL